MNQHEKSEPAVHTLLLHTVCLSFQWFGIIGRGLFRVFGHGLGWDLNIIIRLVVNGFGLKIYPQR